MSLCPLLRVTEASLFFFYYVISHTIDFDLKLCGAVRTQKMEKYMSIVSVDVAVIRIKTATLQSKIAIFIQTINKERVLDVMFDNTVLSQFRIRNKDENYVGSFHRRLNYASVRRTLLQALK